MNQSSISISTLPALLQDAVARSKKVTRRRRRTIARDREAIAITRVFAPVAVSAAAAPLVSPPISLSTPANDDHKEPSETDRVMLLVGGRKSEEKSAKATKWKVGTARIVAFSAAGSIPRAIWPRRWSACRRACSSDRSRASAMRS